MTPHISIRPARADEQTALESLQRRASLNNPGDRDALDAGTLRTLQAQNKAHNEIVELDRVVDLAPLVRLRRRALPVRRDEASARIE